MKEFDMYKLKDWIDVKKLQNSSLSSNVNAIQFLDKNPIFISWYELSNNPHAIPILEKNIDKIDWCYLSSNENAISILLKYPKKINNYYLSLNPNAHLIYKKYPDKIFYANWVFLSKNCNNMCFLESYLHKIDWLYLSMNEHAVSLLEKHLDKINWYFLSYNSNAISLIETNFDKINWFYLSMNKNAIHILNKNMDKLHFNLYCKNTNANMDIISKTLKSINDEIMILNHWLSLSGNPNAISLIKSNKDKINWFMLSKNPNIFEYDYFTMKNHFLSTYGKELIQSLFNPKNSKKWKGWGFEEDSMNEF
jgi:hypothetical protein